MNVEAFGIEKSSCTSSSARSATGGSSCPSSSAAGCGLSANITSLLASISLGYPVGTVMMLRTGGETRFKQRAVEGVGLPSSIAERLLLDGQQRLTSLFQALMLGSAVATPDDTSGWFYVDIRAALDESIDREEAFHFIPADRVRRSAFGKQIDLDLSTPEKEYETGLFPLDRVFDPDEWAEGFDEHHDYEREIRKLWNSFNRSFIVTRCDSTSPR